MSFDFEHFAQLAAIKAKLKSIIENAEKGFAPVIAEFHTLHEDVEKVEAKLGLISEAQLDADLANKSTPPQSNALIPTLTVPEKQAATTFSTGNGSLPDAVQTTGPTPVIETKTYADGTTATGVAPLPEHSPAEPPAA